MKIREKDQHITIKKEDLQKQLAGARRELIPSGKVYRNKGRFMQEYDRNMVKKETDRILSDGRDF